MTISRPLTNARLVAVLVMGLFLAACGSDPSDVDRVSLSYSQSPINELLGFDVALREGDLIALEASAEQSVAECMKAAGFDYVPVDFAQFDPEGDGSTDTRAWAEQNGYGISVQPEQAIPTADEFDDPNIPIRQSLTSAELEVYQFALYGEQPAEDGSFDPANRTGCVAESYQGVVDARRELGAVGQFYSEFADELAALDDRFQADPRFLALEEQWATCMAESGFLVASRGEIFVELDRRMSEVGPLIVPGQDPSAEAQAAMDEVADWERQAAVTDWDCTEPVKSELQTLRYGYEALFVEENNDRLTG
jgi:hypothetical protein